MALLLCVAMVTHYIWYPASFDCSASSQTLAFFEPAFFEPAFFESFSTILDFVDFKSLYFSCAEDDKLQMLCH